MKDETKRDVTEAERRLAGMRLRAVRRQLASLVIDLDDLMEAGADSLTAMERTWLRQMQVHAMKAVHVADEGGLADLRTTP